MINQLFMLSCLLYGAIIPIKFAFWDHFLPHMEAEIASKDEENKKVDREVREYLDEKTRELGRAEYKEWCDAQDQKWSEERRKEEEERSRRWGEGRGGVSSVTYEGTCGPPDRDK